MIKHIANSFTGMNRKEKNGSYFCIPTLTEFPIFLNSTAYQIYCMCDSKTITDVIKKFSEMYPDVPHEKIKNDVKNTLWYLYNIGFITKPEEFEEEENPKTRLADELIMLDEHDFYLASDFALKYISSEVKNSIHVPNIEVRNFSDEVVKNYYSVSQMRMRHVMGTEVYYKLVQAEKSDFSVILGISMHSFGRVAYIESSFSSDSNLFEKALNLASNYLKTFKIDYLKITLTDCVSDKNSIHTLLKSGFEFEATVKGEAKEGNLTVLSKALS